MKTPQQYASEGFVAPIRVMSVEQARQYRTELEKHEARHGQLSRAERNNPHLLFLWADAIVRSAEILQAVETIYGGNLLVWGSTLFIKEPQDPGFISWHQDSTYWGLDPADLVTAWIAISDSREDNGALQIVPGSHKWDQIAHRDTFADGNMLSRGQEIAVEVSEEQAHTLELEPGEMSLHHVRMVHGSQANRSDRRRIGFAVRYLPTHVRPKSGSGDSASLVAGVDRFHHFEPERRPKQDYGEAERAFHAQIETRTLAIIMGGAEAG
ncbi:phytanoyl-CoA dioxygenase family protein [Erythrobacter sp. W53]|uniref:phytanoyl-CoA dioxygenase family protein n=1 Tax=Erythrobacter sp. W53 TaxID=3425947 RepID=UPI003D768D9F